MPARFELQLTAVAVRDAVGAANRRELVGTPRAATHAACARRHALAAVGTYAVRAYTV